MMKLSSTGENRPMSIDVHPDLRRSNLAATSPETEALDDGSEARGWVETTVTALAAAIAVLFVSYVAVITAFS
jgi:hypothetical protein